MLHNNNTMAERQNIVSHQEGTGCRLAVGESLAGLVETEPVSPMYLVGAPSASGSSTPVSRNKPRERPSRSTSGANTCTETDKASLCSDMSLEEGDSSQSRPPPRRRKRKKASGSSNSGDSAPELASMTKTPKGTTKRGRGRPPTTGHYVGLAKAKERMAVAERELMRIEAEKEAAKIADSIRTRRAARPENLHLNSNDEEVDWAADIEKSCSAIEMVAKKSGNLKGTFVRCLKEASATIREHFEKVVARSTDTETRRLQKKVDQLQSELQELRTQLQQRDREETVRERSPPSHLPVHQADKSMEAVSASPILSHSARSKRQVERSSAPHRTSDTGAALSGADMATLETVMGPFAERIINIVDARIAGIEDRLLPAKRTRPPLAADRRQTDPQLAPLQRSSADVARNTAASVPKRDRKSRKAKKSKAQAAPASSVAPEHASQQGPQPRSDNSISMIR